MKNVAKLTDPSNNRLVALKRAGDLQVLQARSPRIRRASWISLGIMVTRLA